MRERGHDIIELLEKEKRWHLEQLKIINEVLAIFKEKKPIKKRRQIKWSSEIDNILQSSERPLSMREIRDKFIEKGVSEAKERGYYNTIFATLKRKIEQKLVKKTEDGRYYWARKEEKNRE